MDNSTSSSSKKNIPVISPRTTDHQHSCNEAKCIPNLSNYEADSEDGNIEIDRDVHKREQFFHPHRLLHSDNTPIHSQHHRFHGLKSTSCTSHRHRSIDNDKVTLLVDGKRFIISPNLLTKHPNTMLGR